MFEQATYQEQRTVAVASSEASAELAAATLTVHGIPAATASVDRVYPSVSWAQGYQVVVAAADEVPARQVLADLTADDLDGVDFWQDDPEG